MKRLAAPRTWSIHRKSHKWVVKPLPGAHPIEQSVPLLIVIRDMLHYCDTSREAKRIIGSREIVVDGKVARKPRQPIGLMDVVSIPRLKQHYRMLIDTNGKFRLVKITGKEAKWKLCRIENKTIVSGGKTQLNLYDGRNMLVGEDNYKTGDVLEIELPSQKILAHYPLVEGNIALLTGGKHIGEIARLKDYIVTRSPKPNIVEFREGFTTVKNNVFVVGQKTPRIKLPEARAI